MSVKDEILDGIALYRERTGMDGSDVAVLVGKKVLADLRAEIAEGEFGPDPSPLSGKVGFVGSVEIYTNHRAHPLSIVVGRSEEIRELASPESVDD